MITFKTLFYKNFLSTGNVGTTIKLDRSPTTLVLGKNGEGKSTMLDALTFVLFNKPFRDISKPQLINSINGKNCYTEIEFSVREKTYVVKRGIKPSIFEIWCDGDMVNQDAATKDYQKVLEKQILGLNYKTFTQVVILGSASFVPFMQLPAGQRREVIEDILDIKIFSIMNQILKERSQYTKDETTRIDDAVTLAKEKVSAQKKLLETISTTKSAVAEKIKDKINEAELQLSRLEKDYDSTSKILDDLTNSIGDEAVVKSDLRKAQTALARIDSHVEIARTKKNYITSHDQCTQCEQSISEAHKQVILEKNDELIDSYLTQKSVVKSAEEKIERKLDTILQTSNKITQVKITLASINSSKKLVQKQIDELKAELIENKGHDANLEEEREKLRKLAEDAMTMLEVKNTLIEQKSMQEIASMLLKDTGIKTAIIREYLPLMNKLINKYLNVMDAYIHFELNESFEEVIKSRHRDNFTYASFSEGEKQKIDIALLFAWRQIAKMKNSVNTNLLIMDEIFDSSLDVNGTEMLLSMLEQFSSDTNIFIISHKGDGLFDKFRSVVRFEKRNDFSVMV